MKSPVVKRSIVIANHKTSVSLEDAFWKSLKDIAGRSRYDLVRSGRQHRHRSAITAICRRRSGCLCSITTAARPRRSRAQPPRDMIGMRTQPSVCAPSRSNGGPTGGFGLTGGAGVGAAARGAGAPSARGAARGFGAGITLIAGGSGGAGGAWEAHWSHRHLAPAPTAAGDGTGTASSGGTFASRTGAPAAAPSDRPASPAAPRRAAQANSPAHWHRWCGDGACHGPFSAIESVGRGPPTCDGVPASVSTASSEPSARSTFAAADKIGAAGAGDDMAQPRLPGRDGDGRFGVRRRQRAVLQRRRHEIADATGLGRNAEIDGADHRVEHARIEARKLGASSADGAGAGQRADECGGAAAGRLEFSAQRHLPRNRRPLRTAADDCCRIGIVQRELARTEAPSVSVTNASRPSSRPFASSAVSSSNTTSEDRTGLRRAMPWPAALATTKRARL